MADVLIATALNEPEAELIRGLLGTEGIPSYYRPAVELSFGYPASSDAWSGRHIYVSETDAERARAVLEASGGEIALPGT